MNKQIELLVTYQDVDKQLKLIEDELRKSEVSQKYLTARKFLQTVNDTLANLENKAKVIADSYDITMKEIDNLKKIANDYAEDVEKCENDNELNYLKKKFQSTLDNLNNFENKLNSLTSDMDELLKEFDKLRKMTSIMKAQHEEYSPKYQELKKSKDATINELKSKLDEIKKDIEPKLMEKYTTRRNDNKFPIVYEVDISNKQPYCPACATLLSKNAVDELSTGEIRECESCRKLLYIIEK